MQDKKRSLPHFNSHTGHRKLEHLREGSPPEPYVQDFLHQVTGERRRNEVRILDMGCGRGDLVAWLCEQGWDAWGADPEETYLYSGKPLLGDRIRRIENGLPFVDSSFDVILSSQVLEHVEDLSGFVGELARVSKLGAEGLHIFPAPRQPVEGHMLVPFVHWLPKGRCRQYALYPILASGLGRRISPNTHSPKESVSSVTSVTPIPTIDLGGWLRPNSRQRDSHVIRLCQLNESYVVGIHFFRELLSEHLHPCI